MPKEGQKTGERERWLTRHCQECRVLFRTSRSDASLCSPKCRMRALRKREDEKFKAVVKKVFPKRASRGKAVSE